MIEIEVSSLSPVRGADPNPNSPPLEVGSFFWLISEFSRAIAQFGLEIGEPDLEQEVNEWLALKNEGII